MVSPTPYETTLLRQFIGDLLHHTLDCPTAAAHQQALQAFLDALSPWVLPHELPTLLGSAFQLFAAYEWTPTADGTDANIAVALSPQGEVIFRAWLRRRGVDSVLCNS